MVLHHAFDVQLFNGNDAEAVDDAPCVLMAEIMAAVSHSFMDTGKNLVRLLSCKASFLGFGLFASRFCKCLLILAEEARVLDELAVGQGRKGFQSNVYADGFFGRRQGFGSDFTGNADKPFARLPS